MRKKIKDITIGDMIEVCNRHKNTPCYECPLFNQICGRIAYTINCNVDIDKEVDLCLK